MKFINSEEREILGYVLELNIPFEIAQKDEVTWFKFERISDDNKIELFSFAMVYSNGMANTAFDLSCLDDIAKWHKRQSVSALFNTWLDSYKDNRERLLSLEPYKVSDFDKELYRI
jgi:hypothetical protein